MPDNRPFVGLNEPFVRFNPDGTGDSWCVFDESGMPVGLTVRIVGVGDFVIPLVPKVDS